MTLRSLVLVVAALVSVASSACAQGALYITPIFTRASVSKADPDPTFSFLGVGTTSRMFYGVNFGGYYDVPNISNRIEVGLDIRDSVEHGNNALFNSFLVGARIAGTPLGRNLHIYVEPLIGTATTRSPNTQVRVNKVEYGGLAGIDDKFSRFVTFRVIEVGYTTAVTSGGQTVGIGNGGALPKANFINLSSGFTFNLPRFDVKLPGKSSSQ
jgi:hypothetical protein